MLSGIGGDPIKPALDRTIAIFKDLAEARELFPKATHMGVFNGSHRQAFLCTRVERVEGDLTAYYEDDIVAVWPSDVPWLVVNLKAVELLSKRETEERIHADGVASKAFHAEYEEGGEEAVELVQRGYL